MKTFEQGCKDAKKWLRNTKPVYWHKRLIELESMGKERSQYNQGWYYELEDEIIRWNQYAHARYVSMLG